MSEGGAATIFRDNFAAAHAIAQRLGKSYRQLAGLFLLSPASLPELDDEDQEAVDAFLKRFEQLVSAIQDTLFRGLAILEGESLTGRSRRDVAELMERLGALSSSRRFGEIAAVCNRLAHLYPTDPERQAVNLNAAHAATADLLATLDGIRDYATAKGRADLGGFEPVGAGATRRRLPDRAEPPVRGANSSPAPPSRGRRDVHGVTHRSTGTVPSACWRGTAPPQG